MKTTVVDDKVVIVEGPHDSTTSQGTQEAKRKKKKPRFLPRKKKKSTTSNPKVHLTLKRKKGSENFEEEGFEEEATEKDIASKKVSELCEEEGFEEEATSIPKVHLTLKSKKGSEVIEEEGFEEEAMEKDTASDAKVTEWDTVFFGMVKDNEYSYEEEAGDVDVVVGSNATTNQMNSAAGEDEEKLTEQVEEEKAKTCCFQNCNKEAVVWPFQKAKRPSKRLYGYCKSCNEARLETMSVKRKESRGNISDNLTRKKLYGWSQEAPVSFQECTEMPDYTANQVKLGFVNRDFLHSFDCAGRMMVGKEGTVEAAKKAWHAISHTSQPGGKTKP